MLFYFDRIKTTGHLAWVAVQSRLGERGRQRSSILQNFGLRTSDLPAKGVGK